jgi:hypothetical protein
LVKIRFNISYLPQIPKIITKNFPLLLTLRYVLCIIVKNTQSVCKKALSLQGKLEFYLSSYFLQVGLSSFSEKELLTKAPFLIISSNGLAFRCFCPLRGFFRENTFAKRFFQTRREREVSFMRRGF